MALKIGIDVGGTFTDFLVAEDGREPRIHKILSTPVDPSIAVIDGLGEIAASQQPAETLEDFAGRIDTIVHGTTVTTNATLTGNGARTGLVTTAGLRDALEMRRGIREEQYNNRYRLMKKIDKCTNTDCSNTTTLESPQPIADYVEDLQFIGYKKWNHKCVWSRNLGTRK